MRFIWRRATTNFVHCYAIGMPGGGGAVLGALCSHSVPFIVSHERDDGPVCSRCERALEDIYRASTNARRPYAITDAGRAALKGGV